MSNKLTHLLLLDLPDIVLLVAIRVDFEAIWHIDPCFWQVTVTHSFEALLVHLEIVVLSNCVP